MQAPNRLFSIILALTHKKLYLAGVEAISKIKRAKVSDSEEGVVVEGLNVKVKTHKHVSWWNSVFTGIAVIANRITPRHRDSGGAWCWYDLLFSAGTHRQAFF